MDGRRGCVSCDSFEYPYIATVFTANEYWNYSYTVPCLDSSYSDFMDGDSEVIQEKH